MIANSFSIPIISQAATSLASALIWKPHAELSMPIETEKYVELQCHQNIIGFIIPLSYNILLTLLCAICAFITRKLPENFNESLHIFISVFLTLFIWIAIIPTYFVAFYAFHKAVLLALALFLISIIVVLCLFGPKILTVYFSPESKIKVSAFLGSRAQKYEYNNSSTSK